MIAATLAFMLAAGIVTVSLGESLFTRGHQTLGIIAVVLGVTWMFGIIEYGIAIMDSGWASIMSRLRS